MAAIVLSNFVSVIPVKAIQAEKPVEDTNTNVSEQAETTAEQETEEETNESQQEETTVSKEGNEEDEKAVQEAEQQPKTEESTEEPASLNEEEVQKDPVTTNRQETTTQEDTSTEQKEDLQPETEEQEAEKTEIVEEDFNLNSPLLITEISPNSKGTDNFEYFEVYNNTNQTLPLADYAFIYHYTDSGKEVEFKVPATTIEPQETLVFWFNNNGLTLEDFNNHYGLELTKDQVVEYKDVFPGFANGGNRAAVIKDKEGNGIVAAAYLPDETDNEGKVVQYKYAPGQPIMDKLQVLAEPTPGTIETVQVPAQPVEIEEVPLDAEAPVITHTAVTEAQALNTVKVNAAITDNESVSSATLYYKLKDEADFQSIKMNADKEDGTSFSAEIPAASVQSDFVYYIEATDGINSSKTEEYQVKIEVPEETYSDRPLLITELSPNSAGGGTDYYEYFELYNNTNQSLSLTNYSFVYKYTDSGKEVTFQVPATTIEPQQTLVFWFNNGDRYLEEFNQNFGLNLSSENVVEFKDVFPGFANGGNRAIVIKDNTNTEIISASYLGTENDNTGAVIQYLFPSSGSEMAKLETLAAPTPGMVEQTQVPTKPVELDEIPEDSEAPVITHTPITESDAFSPITIQADVVDNMAVPFATLYYKKEGEQNFTSLAMNASSDSASYTAEIIGANVDANITYYIEASDGINTVKTEEYEIKINKEDVDYTKIPAFLVTEIVPDTANVGSADGYEFIEVYNNTDQDLSFKDYKVQYRYGTDPASDVVWPSIPDDVVIPAQETLVFWIINGQNGEQTVADFNAHFGTNLVENKNIVKIHSDGMANGSARGLVVATNTKEEITVSYYNDVANVDDTVPDKGILYKYPEDGSKQAIKVSAGVEDATPGSVEGFQVPKQPVHIEKDTVAPTIENKTAVIEVEQTEDIEIAAAASDNLEVKSVRLFYRTNDQDVFNETLLALDSESHLYKNMIYASDLIGKEYVEYFFAVSDGVNEVRSDTFKITINSDVDNSDLRLNMKDNDVVSGKEIIKATSKDEAATNVAITVDGEELKENTYHSLENEAYLALEVNGLNTYFQNAVTMGEDILFLMDKDWLSHWKTFTIPVDPDRLQVGENVLTVRAGNKASPFQLEEDEENRDDYSLRNVRLILADGTVITDPNKNDPSKVYDMGDDGTFRPFEDFTFTITEEHATAQTYNWDTMTVDDGEHTIEAKDSNDTVSTSVLVDNTAPTVEATVVEGKEYKGEFTIDPTVTDEIAGVQSVKVMLDGKQIEVPYQTASSQLEPGAHTVTIVAEDKVGNKAEKVVQFSVTNENPNKPELISPADNGSEPVNGDPTLKVKVTDPTGDDLDVTFYEGYKYDAANTESVKVFKNATDTEPPQTMNPEGEEALNQEDLTLVSEKDGEYLITDSSEQFPYHRFDVEFDSSVSETDTVELSWNGQSLEGRKVSMYAWNHEENDWTLLTYKIAGKEDFELKSTVEVATYVKDSKINVLIQDEIPSSPEEYDYTFVWMSDTQYYSESYPYIFDRQTSWIAEKQEELKIEYVFHTGDLVDNFGQEQEWIHADEYMGVLDQNNVPYGVLAGNHDVDQLSNDYTEYYKLFGEDRFKDKDYYGGSYKNNRGHYDLISANGNDFIMVYMGWGVQDEDLNWINDVLAQYPDRTAILSFHEYLLVSGNRSPIGDKIYEAVVEPNANVIAVLSGHYHDSETLISEIDDDGDGQPDREVYQMLGDYQGGPEGGQGYMKLLHFDQDNNRVFVNTYSPYLDDYNFYEPEEYPGKDELIMDLDLQVKEKRVATDYFSVTVKTDKEIGKQENISSGETAQVKWTGLTENNTYSWYALAEDKFTGKTASDIWTFTKGEATEQGEGDQDPGEGDQDPGEGDQDPGEGDQDPGEGDQDPGEGDQDPGEGDQDPGEGDQDPGEGDQDPGEGDQDPGEGDQDPGDGDQDPGEGDQDPGDGDQKPDGGDQDPGNEDQKPDNGEDKESPDRNDQSQNSLLPLPNTATNMFNLLIIGALVIALGGVLLFILRKNKSALKG
ncbi:LPXTG cell wall anchor domain-containing protein [Metabacillus halosaccharovorans]|nr:LPXTG cell wall anchor domain-containing protein [Metabacillus halosaccharovorans]